jgi:hypothetical protein
MVSRFGRCCKNLTPTEKTRRELGDLHCRFGDRAISWCSRSDLREVRFRNFWQLAETTAGQSAQNTKLLEPDQTCYSVGQSRAVARPSPQCSIPNGARPRFFRRSVYCCSRPSTSRCSLGLGLGVTYFVILLKVSTRVMHRLLLRRAL